ncbi:MAG: F0F1 ATP synthase subunit B, partial [Planctomycetes bacterium]|nr:F0F1 ATP synthase subunit B [Planctomycetota bacterium]
MKVALEIAVAMRTRVAACLVLAAAVACGYCAAADVPATAAAASAPEGRSASGHAAENPAEALNPITFRGINFRGDLAIWTAVVFLLVMAVLWKFAWRPIADGLDKREQNIADQIADADAANQQAKELLADYERKLDEAGDQVRGILDQGRRDAEQLGRELLEKAKKEADVEQQRAMGRIETATDDALKGLADRSAAMAVELAGRIVREKLDPKDHT